MKVPIPGDWAGDDWLCIQLQWPNSPQWLAVLFGLLTYPTRGRLWDESSGSILSAQDVGWEIHDRNFPLVDCAGSEIAGPGAAITSVMGAIESELAMSLCGYNPKAFKIESGQLWVKDFCGEWVEIGALTTPADLPPDTNPADPPLTEWSLCGKASLILDTMYEIVTAAYVNYQDESEFESAIRASAPNITLGRADIWVLYIDILAAAETLDETTILNPDMLQDMKCLALPGMENTGAASDAEVSAIYSSVKSAIWDYVADAAARELLWALYEQSIQVMGENDTRWLIALGASDFTADCTCTDYVPPYAGAVTWKDERSAIVGTQGATLVLSERVGQAQNKMRHIVRGGVTENFQDIQWDEHVLSSGTVRQLEIEWVLNVPSKVGNQFPAEAWSDTEPTSPANYLKVGITGATEVRTYYPVPGRQLVVITWPADHNPNEANVHYAIQLNPKDQNPNYQEFDFEAEIIYSGPLR